MPEEIDGMDVEAEDSEVRSGEVEAESPEVWRLREVQRI